jgi:hypothetical protein
MRRLKADLAPSASIFQPHINTSATFSMSTPNSSDAMPPMITTPPGRYRHYKGMLYEVVGSVRHSETLEPMTLYRALYGEHGLWVRPAAMFNESIDLPGPNGAGTVRAPRFTRIEDQKGTIAPVFTQ